MRGWRKTTIASEANPVLGDLHLTEGTSETVDGDLATAQEIRSRLLLARGTYFLDLREGLPWFQDVIRKGPIPARIRELIRRTIQTHPAVVDVPTVRLEIDRATRAASVVFVARTDTGRSISSEDFGPVHLGG